MKRVNPWLVEMVSNMPPVHLSPFSPPRKKIRIPQPPDFPLISSLVPNNTTPVSIQGARHTNPQFGSKHNPEFSKIQSSPPGILSHDPLKRFPTTITDTTKETDENENFACLLTIGNSFSNPSLVNNIDVNDVNEKDKKKPVFMLFGQPILTEQQLSESWSGDGSVVLQNGQVESSSDEAGPWSTEQKSESGLETSHCKVLIDS